MTGPTPPPDRYGARLRKELRASYRGVFGSFRNYWGTYGGALALLASPYLHFALLLLIPTYPSWTRPGWWDQVLGALPNLLGFSVAALAISLGVGNDTFRNVISGASAAERESGERSPYMRATATFTHFVMVQIVSILMAITCAGIHRIQWSGRGEMAVLVRTIGRHVIWGLGYSCFLYALCITAASVISLFRIAEWFDSFRSKEKDRNETH